MEVDIIDIELYWFKQKFLFSNLHWLQFSDLISKGVAFHIFFYHLIHDTSMQSQRSKC